MEIYSPSGMYDGTFVQNMDFYNVSLSRRNSVLADLFARMDLMERRGSELRKIIEAYEFEENYRVELKPEFRSTESAFFTVLRNLNYDTKNDTRKLKPKDRQEKIIQIMKDTKNITALELSDILLVSIITIKRDLKKLTDENIIEYVGSAKDGYWRVKK